MAKTLSNKEKNFALSSLELLFFGAGVLMGVYDNIISKGNISNLEFYTNGLPASIPALLVAYGVSEDLSKGIRTGSPVYLGHLTGQILSGYLGNYFS